MATAVIPTEQAPAIPEARICPECRILGGAHRSSCTRLDHNDPDAVAMAREIEGYLSVQGR